ncbi:hypothetical protein CsSME_00016889 [Camellia sinensis var. sinensis]
MASMKSILLLVSLSLLVSNSLVLANFHLTGGTDDGSEQWGYVEVRPKAHMFWWLYRSPHRVGDPSNPWPTILWLEGGPVCTMKIPKTKIQCTIHSCIIYLILCHDF